MAKTRARSEAHPTRAGARWCGTEVRGCHWPQAGGIEQQHLHRSYGDRRTELRCNALAQVMMIGEDAEVPHLVLPRRRQNPTSRGSGSDQKLRNPAVDHALAGAEARVGSAEHLHDGERHAAGVVAR